tara:strand:+ start:9541 stop:10062 length:522 start_codon:yes stop_codon:yes gene_type:complete
MLKARFVGALLCVASLTAPSLSQAETYTGLVVSIADGDTATILDASKRQHKVRLAGIDAPEKSQPFGNVSRQHLAGLIFQRTVTVNFAKTDRYRREVGTIIVDGRDANLAQLRAGMAWHYKQYEREQPLAERRAYAAAEIEARETKQGLWREPTPVAPWDFRRTRRNRTPGAQ